MPKKKSIGKLHSHKKLNESAYVVVKKEDNNYGRSI